MIISIMSTIGALANRLGIVKTNLQLWLGFTKADVLGAELVVNGDFVSPTTVGWSNEYDSIFIVENNTLKVTAGSTGSAVSYTINGLTIGTKYNISWGYTVGSGTLPKWRVFNSDQSTGKSYSDVSNSFYFIPTATSVKFSPLYQCGTDGTFYFDNISVKEVAQFIPDKSTNSNNAKLFTGKALEFNGNDAVSDFGNPNINLKSICFWVNLSTTTEQIFNLTSTHNITAASGVITLGGTWSNSNIYVNGLDTTAIGTTPTRVVITTDANILVNDLEFAKIGSDYGALSLADVQIYDAELSLADALIDYNNPNDLVFNKGGSIALSNLKGYYALSEGSGSIAYDSSGEGNNGAITGATYDDKQATIPQLGMVDWSKGSNLIEFSEDFANAAWTKRGFGIISTTESSPVSGLYATKITENDTDGNPALYYTPKLSNGNPQSFGVWLKASSNITIALSTQGDAKTSDVNVTTSWAFFEVSDSSNGTSGPHIGGYSTITRGSGISIWVAFTQFESEATLGSYIGTAGSAASNATLIQNPNDLGKDVLGNSLRLRDGGFNLDGSGYAEVADDSTVNPTTAITVQCWIQSNTESNKGLVAKWTNAEKDYMLLKTTSKFKFYIGANNGESGTIPTSGWVNIAGTYDGANIKTYINGVLSTTTSTTGSIPNSTNILDIGRYNNSQYYSERIDEVMVYNRALYQKEIDNNYKIGLSKHL
ncbi:MAG: Uncharacterised protein [Cryomorphaceae bacterium]|nr:MAG: Uncharacterised protein [Cryomorphaceae bacterium]